MPKPSVAIVVPVRGAHEALRLCVACVAAHTTSDAELYLICQAAEGPAVRDIMHEETTKHRTDPDAFRRHPMVTTTSVQSFARNCNDGAKVARDAEFLVFLNSDAFVGPGWLDALLAPFADQDVVAVGPMGTAVSGHQCADAEGYSPLPASVEEGDPGNRALHVASVVESFAESRKGATPYPARRLVGFCLAVRRSAWDEVGGFDERFENAFCDDDLALRLNLVGSCVVVPDLLVLHAGSASFRELPDAVLSYQETLRINRDRFFDKWERRGLLPFLGAWFNSRGVR